MAELKRVPVNFQKLIFAVRNAENRSMLIRRFIRDMLIICTAFSLAYMDAVERFMLQMSGIQSIQVLKSLFGLLAEVAHLLTIWINNVSVDDAGPLLILSFLAFIYPYSRFATKEYYYFKRQLF